MRGALLFGALLLPPMTASRGCVDDSGTMSIAPMIPPIGAAGHYLCTSCQRLDMSGCPATISGPDVVAHNAVEAAQLTEAALRLRTPGSSWSCVILLCYQYAADEAHHNGRTPGPDPCADAGAEAGACGQPCDGSAGQCEAYGCLGCDLGTMTCAGMP